MICVSKFAYLFYNRIQYLFAHVQKGICVCSEVPTRTLPAGWTELIHSSGCPFYTDGTTTQWEFPEAQLHFVSSRLYSIGCALVFGLWFPFDYLLTWKAGKLFDPG